MHLGLDCSVTKELAALPTQHSLGPKALTRRILGDHVEMCAVVMGSPQRARHESVGTSSGSRSDATVGVMTAKLVLDLLMNETSLFDRSCSVGTQTVAPTMSEPRISKKLASKL